VTLIVIDAKFILIFLAVVVACFAFALVLKSRRRDERMIVQQSPLPTMRTSLGGPVRRVDVALGRELLQMLEGGDRAGAVALVRERTGWGPQEASEAVERLDSLRKRVSS
jgi:hypothetical protein